MPASAGLENSTKERLFLWLMTIRLNCCSDKETLYVCVRVCSSRFDCVCVCVCVCMLERNPYMSMRECLEWEEVGRDREESGKIVEELV